MSRARTRLGWLLALMMSLAPVAAEAHGFGGWAVGTAGGSGGSVLIVPVASGPPLESEQAPFIDNNTVFLSCLFGAAIGFAMVNFNPVASWSYYEGFPMGPWALVSRGGLGCYFGLLFGVVASAIHSTGTALERTWDELFGTDPDGAPGGPAATTR